MKTLEEIKASRRIAIMHMGKDGFDGMIYMPTWEGTVVCSTGAGWEHVSVCPKASRITPSWDDMCKIKDIFFKDDEAVIQVHPPKAEYVNFMPNCLHLWRCKYKEMVLPPAVLVGPTKDMSPLELNQAIKEAYKIAGEEY